MRDIFSLFEALLDFFPLASLPNPLKNVSVRPYIAIFINLGLLASSFFGVISTECCLYLGCLG